MLNTTTTILHISIYISMYYSLEGVCFIKKTYSTRNERVSIMEKKIKSKTTTSITIDMDLYLKTKTTENFNLSGTVNEFLKKLFETEEEQEEILIQELQEMNKKKTYLEYELSIIKQNKEKERQLTLSKEQKEQAKLKASIPTGDDFHSKLAREKILKENPGLQDEQESF